MSLLLKVADCLLEIHWSTWMPSLHRSSRMKVLASTNDHFLNSSQPDTSHYCSHILIWLDGNQVSGCHQRLKTSFSSLQQTQLRCKVKFCCCIKLICWSFTFLNFKPSKADDPICTKTNIIINTPLIKEDNIFWSLYIFFGTMFQFKT